MTQLAATPTRAGGAEVTFRLNRAAAQVEMRVLNVAGRPVANVPVGQGEVGLNRVVWNGLAEGHRVPAGRYMIEVTATAADNDERASALSTVVIER
jgi:flagellar hook assembly protein FlgD